MIKKYLQIVSSIYQFRQFKFIGMKIDLLLIYTIYKTFMLIKYIISK